MGTLRVVIFLLILVGASPSSSAQVFCKQGATWVFVSNLTFSSCWQLYEKCTYTGDTIINGDSTRIVEFHRKYHYNFNGSNLFSHFKHYFKVVGDTVSILDGDMNWKEIYNFSLQTGDTTHSPLRINLAFGSNCHDSLTAVYNLPAVVTNHGDTVVGSDTLRFYTVFYQSFNFGDPTDTIFKTETYYERFITFNNWYPKDPWFCNMEIECDYVDFECYRDDELVINPACNDLTWFDLIGIESQSTDANVVVYPNPSTEILIVSGTTIDYESFDILCFDGKLILNNVKSPVNVSELPSGIYFLTNQNRTVYRKFIKI